MFDKLWELIVPSKSSGSLKENFIRLIVFSIGLGVGIYASDEYINGALRTSLEISKDEIKKNREKVSQLEAALVSLQVENNDLVEAYNHPKILAAKCATIEKRIIQTQNEREGIRDRLAAHKSSVIAFDNEGQVIERKESPEYYRVLNEERRLIDRLEALKVRLDNCFETKD
ncbi:hypothetical protein F9L33_14570 [Amylibacter sp. SFDW26]|uniref:hypothetical protein n=1 Tax=Amylibacter sp. SFDW26 TaxID=2652722 RepID=UPI001262A161|nr:hypothetical protein [Amylibacter sp. SFDW26]KAB7610118.1 hypothetical protein F9L33_14570 [Amylibacter sp. SFDW26]